MTRHGKNCTAGSVYTYHERKRDSQESGFGSHKLRLGRDSIREFDCCCLTLQPCRHPVVTPDGYIFDKEAILEYILTKKRENSKKMKEYEKQKVKLAEESDELAQTDAAGQLEKFEKHWKVGADKADAEVAGPSSASSVSNMAQDKAKQLPSFWVPNLAPKAKPTLLKKPDDKVLCPMSGRSLKMKDLMDVTFTPIKDGDSKKAVIVKGARYVCAVTNDILGNSVPCAVLRTSGNVVTLECVENIIKKDMVDPTNGKKLKERDIILLQRGALGFSGSGVQLEAKKDGPALMA
ncbi:Nitric oxide synthase-interacting protein [Lamellibrachia satsuma]|nr:Nitric oxide synthase-interacting protein [Lamellibrachia satsuma]